MYAKLHPMKTIINTVAFLLLGFGVNAQTEAQLAEWQAKNPGKLIMTQENYYALDSELQELIAATVVFKDQIGFGLFGFEEPLDRTPETRIEDRDFIKNWLAQNSNTKIITRSEYDASPSEDQLVYDRPHILVLIGDVLTKQDILNF